MMLATDIDYFLVTKQTIHITSKSNLVHRRMELFQIDVLENIFVELKKTRQSLIRVQG